MFNKKKQQSLYNSVDDSRSTVYDFTLRSTPVGFESYRTTEYTLYHKLDEAEMIPKSMIILKNFSPVPWMMPTEICSMRSFSAPPGKLCPTFPNSTSTTTIPSVVS